MVRSSFSVSLSPFAIDIQCDAQLNFLSMIDLIHLYRWIYLRCQINRRKGERESEKDEHHY